MGEILIPRRTKVEKGYELLADITVGTATTSVDITGLNIGKGDEVVLVSEIVNSSLVAGFYASLYFNSNFTDNNYYVQQLTVSSTGCSGTRNNNAYVSFAAVFPENKTSSFTNIKIANSGFIVFQSHTIVGVSTSSINILEFYSTTTFTSTSIGSLRLQSSATNGINSGSRFQLYLLGGA